VVLRISRGCLSRSRNGPLGKITPVIACYRDAQAIPFMYKRLKAVCARIRGGYEIILVNDCSPDNADEILAEIAESPQCVVIRHSRNCGS